MKLSGKIQDGSLWRLLAADDVDGVFVTEKGALEAFYGKLTTTPVARKARAFPYMGFTPEQEQEYRAQEDALAAITKLLHETTLAANEAARKDRQQHNEQAKTRSLDRWSPAKAQAGDEGDEDDGESEDEDEETDEEEVQNAMDAHNAPPAEQAPPAAEQPKGKGRKKAPTISTE